MKIDQVTYQPPFVQRNKPISPAEGNAPTQQPGFRLPDDREQAQALVSASGPEKPGSEEIASADMARFLSDEEKRFLSAVLAGPRSDFGAAAYERTRTSAGQVGSQLDLKG